MKKATRFLSLALAAAITFTSLDVNVYAAELNSSAQEIIVADDASSEEETTSPEEETTQEETTGEQTSEEPSEEQPSNENETIEDEDVPKAGESEEEEQTEEASEEDSEELELEEAEEEDLLEITAKDLTIEGTTVTGYTGKGGAVVIPEGITAIKPMAFEGKTAITSISLPNSLTTIGYRAFYNCKGITSITIPSSVREIGFDAFAMMLGSNTATTVVVNSKSMEVQDELFHGRTLTSVSLPEGMSTLPKLFNGATFKSGYQLKLPSTVTSISDSAFVKTKGLSKVIFGDKLTTIGQFSFSDSSISALDLPESVTEIKFEAFYNCKNLTSITIPEKVRTIGYGAFAVNGASPATKLVVNSKNITGADIIFKGRVLTSVSLPEGMAEIPRLFESATFTTGYVVDIPESATTIADSAFRQTKGLKTVNFKGNKLSKIGMYAFDNSSISQITFPNSLTEIGFEAFHGCVNLTDITIPEQVRNIGYGAFNLMGSGIDTKLTVLSKSMKCEDDIFKGRILSKVSLPEGMVELPGLFCRAGFMTGYVLEVPASVTTVGLKAFNYATGLKTVVFKGDKVTKIDMYAFSESSIETINLPNSVKSIEFEGFYRCKSLEKVFLGPNISRMGYQAFYDCPMATFYVTGTGSATEKSLLAQKLDPSRIVVSKSIKYQLNGGVATGNNPTGFTNSDGTIKVTDPKRESYRFLGWYTDAAFKNSAGTRANGVTTIDVSKLTGTLTLFAKWEGPLYTISFDAAKGGKLKNANQAKRTVAKGNELGKLPEVTANGGYTFVGWYTADGVQVAETEKVAKDDTYIAHYKKSNAVTYVDTPVAGIWGDEGKELDGATLYAYPGDKLFLNCATEGATINATVKMTYNSTTKQLADKTIASGAYKGMITLTEPGNYTLVATATKGGKTSTELKRNIYVFDDYYTDASVKSIAEDNIWLWYDGKKYDAKRVVTVPFVGGATKLDETKLRVYCKDTELYATDYTVTYKNNTKPAAYNAVNAKNVSIAPTVIITLKGSYAGKLERTFTIKEQQAQAIKLTAANTNFVLDATTFEYNGNIQKPKVVKVEYKQGKAAPVVIPKKENYTVSGFDYSTVTNKASITITFNGTKYYGTFTKNYSITPCDLKKASDDKRLKISITNTTANNANYAKASVSVNGVASAVDLKYDLSKHTAKFIKNKDGSISCEYTITGKGNYKGTAKVVVPVSKTNLSNCNFYALNNAAYANLSKTDSHTGFAGKVVAPLAPTGKTVDKNATFTVADSYKGILKANADYTIKYQVKEPGAAAYTDAVGSKKYPAGTKVKMTIEAKPTSLYTGSKSIEYTIGEIYAKTDVAASDLSVQTPNVIYANKANNYKTKLAVKDLRLNTALAVNKDFKIVKYTYVDQTEVTTVIKGKKSNDVRAAGEEVKATDIIPAGTKLAITLQGLGRYANAALGTYQYRVAYNASALNVKVKDQTFVRKASGVIPSEKDMEVTFNKQAVPSSNYVVTSVTKNITAGTATMVVEGRNQFTGTKKVTFKISKSTVK
ncbi:Listeria/Bacterioides repeat-containing protein [Pseudobutyrivibrio sp. OR37]|uniref:leucine-rich repeat protein n=1 Tax=Pseudobutyrivibrio sp. OR37 TaxID=1798186 RepID=UPI0008DFBDEB|nr:leucine-rich repeat protein [Pseudobutyrivibrio sp. OR37]SFH98946.1 Listeria/Bacterioides repeat-containing protein [Pseudobutyrivibrio sp. OR37]